MTGCNFFDDEWNGEEDLPFTPIPNKFYTSLAKLTDEEYGRLVRWSQAYFMTGEELPLSGTEDMLAGIFKADVGYYVSKYVDKRRKAKKSGSLGGKAKSASHNQTNFDLVSDDADCCENCSVATNQPSVSSDATNRYENSSNKKGKGKENENKKEKGNNTPYSPPEGGVKAQFSPGFVQFWAVYPKRVGKQAAWKSWSKRKCEPLAEVIVSAVNRQKTWDSWTKDAGQYIPNPATWLNQGRWEDEPPELLHQAVSRKRTASDQWADLTDGNF